MMNYNDLTNTWKLIFKFISAGATVGWIMAGWWFVFLISTR